MQDHAAAVKRLSSDILSVAQKSLDMLETDIDEALTRLKADGVPGLKIIYYLEPFQTYYGVMTALLDQIRQMPTGTAAPAFVSGPPMPGQGNTP
jgi:hypothetical protein